MVDAFEVLIETFGMGDLWHLYVLPTGKDNNAG
jgi:hypothetical protein